MAAPELALLMDSISGLPAHPLLVHGPIVMIPLVCLGSIAIAIRPAWRRRWGSYLVAATALMVVATVLAVSSGNAFDDHLNNTEPIDHHRLLAETSRLLVIGLFVAVLGLVLVGRYRDRSDQTAASRASTPLLGALAVITVVAAVASTVWITRTGHEGTKVVWRGLKKDLESPRAVARSSSTPTTVATASGATTPVGNAALPSGSVAVTITDYSLDATTLLKAGAVSFAVTNGESDNQHEFVVMKGRFADLPKRANGAVDETELTAGALIGRTAAISPGGLTIATFTLDPGDYVLLCNIDNGPSSHARDGQRLDVSVE